MDTPLKKSNTNWIKSYRYTGFYTQNGELQQSQDDPYQSKSGNCRHSPQRHGKVNFEGKKNKEYQTVTITEI